jgi:hypothetical protein
MKGLLCIFTNEFLKYFALPGLHKSILLNHKLPSSPLAKLSARLRVPWIGPSLHNDSKVNFPLYLTKHYIMEIYGGVEV